MEQPNFNEAELQEAQELAEDLKNDCIFNNDEGYDHEAGEDDLDDFRDIESRNILFFN